MKIEENIIEEIKNRADIVEIISEYVILKKIGTNFKGVCPFHQEKTPSFIVNPVKQIFHCFGCSAGGNVITFLMNYNKMSFYDVVKDLADRTGVKLVYLEGEKDEEKELKESLKKINFYAKEFYKWSLNHKTHGEIGREYLKKRNISNESQEKFGIGYAQNSWDSLYRYLTQQGFNLNLLEQSGLIVAKEDKSGYYDRFRNRIIFPILDERSDVIAFGGRTLVNNQAKYINSPETPLYIKGDHLYALNWAKESIRSQDYVILVEGYLDVITSHQYGFTNTVATLGTALTPNQARLLLRFTQSKKVIVCYDTDEAGIKAADRGTEVLENVAKGAGISVFIAEVPLEKDPDSYLNMTGKESYQKVINSAKPLIEWEMERVIIKGDTHTPMGKSAIIKNCTPILLKISDRVYRDECVKMISHKLDIREDILRQELKNIWRGRKTEDKQVNKNLVFTDKNIYIAEQQLLFIMLESKEQRPQILAALLDVEFGDKLHNDIKLMIAEFHDKKENFTWDDLMISSPEPELHAKIIEIIDNNIYPNMDFEQIKKDDLACLRKFQEKKEIIKITKEIEEAVKNHNDALASELTAAYNRKLKVKN